MKKLAAILLCVLLACALVVSVQAAGNTSMTITNVVKSVSQRGRGGPVSMTMVVFVVSWGLLSPQGW